ncbi:hypothetical protein V6E27_28660 [Bacillus cereus]
MKIRRQDEKGNLLYKCWKCNKEFNFKAMKYIVHGKDECPNCEAIMKLK